LLLLERYGLVVEKRAEETRKQNEEKGKRKKQRDREEEALREFDSDSQKKRGYKERWVSGMGGL